MLRSVQCFFRASLWGVAVVCPTTVHDIVVGSASGLPDTGGLQNRVVGRAFGLPGSMRQLLEHCSYGACLWAAR
jgi:hypothetical protein